MQNFSGFTLIELMITLAVAAIVLIAGMPTMRNIIWDNRLSSQANELVADFHYARTEAIRRGTAVTVCKSANSDLTDTPATPEPTCNVTAADPWTAGRIMFVDSNSSGTRDANEELLRVRSALEGTANKLLGDTTTAGTANNVIYRANGLSALVPNNGGTQPCVVNTGTNASENQLVLCDGRGFTQARVLVISPTGRVRIAPKGTDMKRDTLTAAACSSFCPAL